MKKFLAVLLVLAMALSVSSVAMAREIDCYEMESYQDGRREGVTIKDMKEGDIIGFYVNPVPGTGIDGVEQTKMYVRHVEGGDTKAKRLDEDGEVTDYLCYSIWFEEDNCCLWTDGECNWYYIEAQIQKDGDNFLAVVTWDEGESGKYPDASVGECKVAGITINGQPVDPARVYGFDGSAATTLATKTTMTDPRFPEPDPTATPAPTEAPANDNVADDVADTDDGLSAETWWMISGGAVAVVLVAAIVVIVVAKKKK